MSDPLYRKELLRLAADAAGAGRLDAPHGSATAHNPACGDRITVDIRLEDGRIAALAHHTQACVLTQASAAILGAQAKGLDRAALKMLADDVAAMLKGGDGALAALPGLWRRSMAWRGTRDGISASCCPWKRRWKALETSEPPKPGA